MAMYRVIEDQSPEPLAAKAAAATSMSNMSGEKEVFVAVNDAVKS
jgi:hypothetical protein